MSTKLIQAVTAAHHTQDVAEERRVSPRKVVSLAARVELPDGTVLEGQTVDLSQTGIGLVSPRLLHAEQDCKLTIILSVCGENLELRLLGRVCYCREQERSRYRTGMRFIRIEPRSADLLNKLLS